MREGRREIRPGGGCWTPSLTLRLRRRTLPSWSLPGMAVHQSDSARHSGAQNIQRKGSVERSEEMAYTAAELALNKEIKTHKRSCFNNLCHSTATRTFRHQQ